MDHYSSTSVHVRRSQRRGRQPNGRPNPIDVYVGQKMRERRCALNLSLSMLARRLGISYQQVQHYECGLNRITASRLWDISQALEISVDFFFEGMDDETSSSVPSAYIIQASDKL